MRRVVFRRVAPPRTWVRRELTAALACAARWLSVTAQMWTRQKHELQALQDSVRERFQLPSFHRATARIGCGQARMHSESQQLVGLCPQHAVAINCTKFIFLAHR